MYELRFTLDECTIHHRRFETRHDLFTFLDEMNLLDEQYFEVYVLSHLFLKNWDETSASCLFNGWTPEDDEDEPAEVPF